IWYVIFIFLYSWFILFEMKAASISWLEWVIIAWICVMVVEEIRERHQAGLSEPLTLIGQRHQAGSAGPITLIDQRHQAGCSPPRRTRSRRSCGDWWGFSAWNRLDLFTMLLALIGIFLRIPEATDAITTGVRTCYILAGVLFYLRGVQLVMIQKMVKELLFYMSILIVALLTYGVAAQALPLPDARLHNQHICGHCIYGEIYLEVAEAIDAAAPSRSDPPEGCEDGSTVDSSGKLCPTHHSLVLLLLAVYLMVVNVLLINLLIAIFSCRLAVFRLAVFSAGSFLGWQLSAGSCRLAVVDWQLSAGSCRLAIVGWQFSAAWHCSAGNNIFKEIQNNSVEIWKFNMYFLVHEYHTRPACWRCRSSSWRMCLPLHQIPGLPACPAAARGKRDCAQYTGVASVHSANQKSNPCPRMATRRVRAPQPARGGRPAQLHHPLPVAVNTRQELETKGRIEQRIQSIYSGLDELYKMCDRIDERFDDERHQGSGGGSGGGDREGSATSTKPRLPPAAAAAAAPEASQPPLQLPSAPTKGHQPCRRTSACPQSTPTPGHRRRSCRRSRRRRAAPTPIGAAPAPADEHQEVEAERKRQRRAEKERRRLERRMRRRSRSRHRPSTTRRSAEQLAGTEEERLVDMERRLRNMEAATTDSLGSIEKLLRQIVKDRSSKPDYARLQ
uniref:Ion_trans domain-containing protein n=1 Tax=Macrostomum lignano TaxID=282301 RepID=A0A1I8FGH3_9PLAT